MNNRHLLRGLFLIAIALAFGGTSFNYNLGNFTRPGPGMFPLLVSGLLMLIGLTTVVRSRFVPPVAMDVQVKNIVLVITSLCGFALLSTHVNMTLGIVFMVFCASYAGSSYSVVRNIKISAGLLAIAYALHKLLGLNLPLF